MNYELKSVVPGSVFFNAVRIFVVVGFIIGILGFFVVNTGMRHVPFWQKFGGTLLFTAVYTVAVSLILTFIAFLYNFYASRFKGIRIHLEQH